MFLIIEYSLFSISGCKFPFPFAVFLQPIDENLEVMETLVIAILFATWQPRNRSQYIHVVLVRALTLQSPGTLTKHPFVVIGSLY